MNRTDTGMAEYLFRKGRHLHAYLDFGCQRCARAEDGEPAYRFRVWAPHASGVTLLSDFTEELPLTQVGETGIWELWVSCDRMAAGRRYRFCITGECGVFERSDPYALACDGRDSLVCDRDTYTWQDAEFLEHRRTLLSDTLSAPLCFPLNIYEIDLSAFGASSFAEAAEALVPYIKYMGYTHIELSAQNTLSYFTLPAEMGSPDDLCRFVDCLHTAGVGVLLDFDPCHVPPRLSAFDGTALYEAADGDGCFDHTCAEVGSFLLSAALYPLRTYHIDGLCIKGKGEDALSPATAAFLRRLTEAVHAEFPDVLLVADDAPDAFCATLPCEEGGLGFSLAEEQSSVESLFSYLAEDPIFRRHRHTSLIPTPQENVPRLLSLSGEGWREGAPLARIGGDEMLRQDTLRAALVYLAAYPGKKRQYMGVELGAASMWDKSGHIDFSLCCQHSHASFRTFVAALNEFYLAHPALWADDLSSDGFAWLDADRADDDIVAFRRVGGGEELIAVLSFNGSEVPEYRLPLAKAGAYEVVFYSGERASDYPQMLCAREEEGAFYLPLRLPPVTALLLAPHPASLSFVLSPDLHP